MHWSARSISCLAASILMIWPAIAIAAPITFRLASDGGTAGNSWIVADGDIATDTPDKFRGARSRECLQSATSLRRPQHREKLAVSCISPATHIEHRLGSSAQPTRADNPMQAQPSPQRPDSEHFRSGPRTAGAPGLQTGSAVHSWLVEET